MPVRLTSELQVKVAGAEMGADIESLLTSWVVEDSVGMADVFMLTFRDPDSAVLSGGRFTLGAAVTIGVHTMEEGGPDPLIDGEITAIEAEYGPDGSITVVRGLDRAHRLFRGRKNVTFKNMKASDIAQKLASAHGLKAKVDETRTVFDQVAQVGESDWQFLKRLADDAGRELSVEAKKLYFREPAPPPGTPLKLVMGENLVNFRATITAAEQVTRVEARSFDSLEELDVVSSPTVRGGPETGTSLSTVGSAFPNQPYVASRSFGTQPEMDAIAEALAADIAHNHAELHGEVGGDPKLRAGTAVKLEEVGRAFSGTYYVTSTRHRFDGASGYKTWFSVAGRRQNSLLGLTSSGPKATAMPGLAIAIVADNNDPLAIGRVKVNFPWLANDFDSEWAQVVYPGAGGSSDARGLCLVPAVGDMVVVGFESGDVDRPFVLGGLYSNKQKPHLTGMVNSGDTLKRSLTSHGGLKVILDDTSGSESVLVSNKEETVMIKLVTASGSHLVEIKCDKDVEITATGNTKLDVTGNIDVKSVGNTKVAATGNLEMSGATVKITATGPMTLKGAVIQLN